MSLLRCVGPRLQGNILSASRLKMPNMISVNTRYSSQFDCTRQMIGDREIVGHGINGCPVYVDTVDCPFPAIRFREVTSEVCALRQKEQADWKKMSLADKKTLYRHSFCQTYAEFQHFTPEWKLCVGVALWTVALGITLSLLHSITLPTIPDTFDEEHQQAQLRRIIHLQVNPVTGVSSKWNYSENKWK